MARTASTMLELGTSAPSFSLPDTNGDIVSLEGFAGKSGLLVMFICNHCPFVKHIREQLSQLGKDAQGLGLGVVAINSNDVEKYPDDAPDQMRREVIDAGFTFPYCFDESQEVAKAYRAACTPDFYLFDGEQRLYYRGQLDSSRPGNGVPVTGEDLRAAIERLMSDAAAPDHQTPSIGCNIKWKPGNEPEYFSA